MDFGREEREEMRAYEDGGMRVARVWRMRG